MNKLTERLVLGAGALVIGLGLGWGVRGLATYNVASESMAAYEDWRVACPPASSKEQRCEMQEDVLDSRNGSIVVRVAITNDKGKPTLGLTLPLGVALPPGVGIAFGTDKPTVFQYRTCTGVGCFAALPMDDKFLASLNAAKEGKVLAAGLDGKVVAIPISFKGYAAATRAYHNAEARRASWVWRLVS